MKRETGEENHDRARGENPSKTQTVERKLRRRNGEEQDQGLKETEGSTEVRDEKQEGSTYVRKRRLLVHDKSVEKAKAIVT